MLGFAETLAQTYATKTVVSSGGQSTLSNKTFGLVATFGQPVIGITGSAEVAVEQGFWNSLARTSSTEAFPITGNKDVPLLHSSNTTFSNSTELLVTLPQKETISLLLYDGLGREVQRLLDAEERIGSVVITLHADGLASGHYVATLITASHQQSLQLFLIH